jgi:SAM-dependent methyltransferase
MGLQLMAENSRIIGLTDWLQTPAGRYLLTWEQHHLDTAVADLFGFHALQLGLPELEALRANRMPHRWVAAESPAPPVEPAASAAGERLPRAVVALQLDFDALPFDSQSLDLVVLPHTLELASDPHQTLREVERVLVPEGRVVVVGFNPASLWGLRQRVGRMRRALGRRRTLFLPNAGEFLGYRRLRDWLRLLSFEVEAGRFGCYRPPLVSEKWLARYEWMDHSGERWWPVFGAVYFVVAVKRVRGMRLVGLLRDQRPVPKAAPAVLTQREREREPA